MRRSPVVVAVLLLSLSGCAAVPRQATQAVGQTSMAPVVSARTVAAEGQAHVNAGRPDDALDAFRRAVRLEPSLSSAWLAIARLQENHGARDELESTLKSALKANPRDALLHNRYGVFLLGERRFAEAREAFIAALDLQPDLMEAQGNLRVSYAWDGAYARALLDVPADERPRTLNNLGYVAMARGDLDAAETFLREALRLSPVYYAKAAENLERLAAQKGQGAR